MNALYRIKLRTKGGLVVYARRPDSERLPITWEREPSPLNLWRENEVLPALVALRRDRKPAIVETVK